MFFTFFLFAAPQAFFPDLIQLHLAKVSAGLAMVALLLSSRRSVGRQSESMAPEARLVLWLTVIAALSIPFSLWPGGSLDELVNQFLKSVIVFFLVANTLESVQRLKLMIGSLALWGLIMSVSAISDFAQGRVATETRIGGWVAPLAMGPNDLALTLNVLLALTIGLFLASRTRLSRGLLLVTMGLMIGGIVASFSRGGFLGLVAIGTAFLIKRARERGLGAVLPLLLLVAVAPLLFPQNYGDRLYSIIDEKYDLTGSSTSRWEVMRLATEHILEHPLFGAGLGMDVLVHVAKGAGWQLTHNAFLQVGVELGVPGMLVFCLLIWRALLGVRRAQRELSGRHHGRELRALGIGVEIACVGYIVGALFHPVPYHFYFYYIAAFSLAVQRLARASSQEPPAR